jgi:hypothetical protein
MPLGNEIHVPHELAITDEEVLRAITAAIGVVIAPPRTITTGCGLRRASSRTSYRPQKVTCPQCRRYAIREYELLARALISAASLPETSELDGADWMHRALGYSNLANEFKDDGDG